MSSFIANRPLSVLIAFAFVALNFLTSIATFASPAMYSRYFMESPAYLSVLPFALVSVALNFGTLVIFYRRPKSSLKAFAISGAINAVFCSVLTGFPPIGSMLCYIALSGWMAYELNGFNVFEWVDGKLSASPGLRHQPVAEREPSPSGTDGKTVVVDKL